MSAVYRDFDQQTLNREYAARDTVPDIGPFMEQYAALSAAARDSLDCRLDVAYGDHPDEVVDIFPAGDGAPVLIFIHGGYWRMLSQKESACMAPGLAAQGIATVTVNYSLAPDASIDKIVAQCRAAVAWTHKNAGSFGGDPDRLFVCGSSAGGHLTGMMVAGGWQADAGLPAGAIKGAIPLSGVFDLEPIRLSNINEWAQLDAEAAERNSPARHAPDYACPLVVSYGGSETSEFKRQSEEYAADWKARGWPVECFESTERNHFDIIFDIGDPQSRLGGAIAKMING